jgi:hypothetical protein
VVLVVYAVAVDKAVLRLRQTDSKLGDLSTSRDAAIALTHGRDIYASGARNYVYPPLIAFLYQPLGLMSLTAAGIYTLATNAVLSLLTLCLAGAEFSRRFLGRTTGIAIARVAFVAALLTTDKIRAEFNMWETNVLMLFMFTFALVCVDRRPLLAGAALGFAFNIKYLPIALLPWLIVRRRWRISGAFLASVLVFALLPAVSMGWSANLSALAAAYGELAGLFRITVHHAAHLYPLTDSRTFSLTSGLARITGWPQRSALFASAMLAATFAAVAAAAYERYHLPLLRCPPAGKQAFAPYRTMFGLEWVAVILLTLIFSPFTNSAHLYILLLVNAAGAAMLMSIRPPASPWPLLIGLAVMHIGITYPPGNGRFSNAEHFSKWMGLPAWCMLVNCAALIWAGVRAFNTPPPTPEESCLTSANV